MWSHILNVGVVFHAADADALRAPSAFADGAEDQPLVIAQQAQALEGTATAECRPREAHLPLGELLEAGRVAGAGAARVAMTAEGGAGPPGAPFSRSWAPR